MNSSFPSPLKQTTFANCALPLLTLLFLSPVSTLLAQRLPSTVSPEHYSLTLTPDLKTATFSGVETIDVTASGPVNTITLNSTEIAFQSVTATFAGKKQTASVTLDAKKEQATFNFPAKLPAGKVKLDIHYTGTLNNELRGFYLSKTDQ